MRAKSGATFVQTAQVNSAAEGTRSSGSGIIRRPLQEIAIVMRPLADMEAICVLAEETLLSFLGAGEQIAVIEWLAPCLDRVKNAKDDLAFVTRANAMNGSPTFVQQFNKTGMDHFQKAESR